MVVSCIGESPKKRRLKTTTTKNTFRAETKKQIKSFVCDTAYKVQQGNGTEAHMK